MNEEVKDMEIGVQMNEKSSVLSGKGERYLLGGITGKGFMPGKSGNPGGRPKSSLKEFARIMLSEMTEEEKKKWLKEHKVKGIEIWQMAEGRPKETAEVTVRTISDVLDELENGGQSAS